MSDPIRKDVYKTRLAELRHSLMGISIDHGDLEEVVEALVEWMAEVELSIDLIESHADHLWKTKRGYDD